MRLPDLYTPEEVAARLKVSRRAVYQWLATGKLRGMKAGQGWRITEADLIAFMQVSSETIETSKFDYGSLEDDIS